MSSILRKMRRKLERDVLKIQKREAGGSDCRYTYGAGCSWNGRIDRVGSIPVPARTQTVNGKPLDIPAHRLPCCPHCKGMLFEVGSESEWRIGAAAHEVKGRVNYVAFIDWCASIGKCWPTLREASLEFTRQTGKVVGF